MFALPLFGTEPRAVHGVVLDGDGAPLAGVCIDHYGAVYCGAQTDGRGAFQIRTTAPVVVMRKPGYAPQVVRLAGKDEVRVVMPAESRPAPPCKPRCDAGIHGSFCFPPVKGVKASRPFNDIDYTARSYVAKVGGKKGGITHGQGSSWSLGLPRDRDVWESVEYSERDYVIGGDILIVDAKGLKSDGTLWRNLGKVGESAFYDRVTDRAVAALLDRGPRRVLRGIQVDFEQRKARPYSHARFPTPLSRSFTRSYK